MTEPQQSHSRRWDDGSGPALSIRQLVQKHDEDIDDLLIWKAELRGAFRLMTLVMGASLISLIVSVVTIITLVSEHRP
jgi:hypothetical protein